MNRIYRMVMMACMVLSLLSCEKILDVKSNAQLVVPSTLSDLQALLDDAAYMNFSTTPTMGECVADDYFLTQEIFSSRDAVSQALYVWAKFDKRFGNDWSCAYLPVYNANLCLEVLQKIPRTPVNAVQWDAVKGAALFFRGYYFSLLTMGYGKAYDLQSSQSDPGIVLRLASDYNIPASRATVAECFSQAISDISQAGELLPDLVTETTRPSKAAAFAMLSRTYIYMRDYANAAKFADECLKLKSTLMNFNGDSDILGLGLNVPFKRFNKETIFYTDMNSYYDINSPTRARIDTLLYASYHVNDLRRTAYFRAASGYQQFKGSYGSSATRLFSGLATDEMFLNRSEGRAFAGDVTGAMEDLNLLLKSRWRSSAVYSPLVATDRADALVKIRRERRKELLMRNIRFSDIKRLNMENAMITIKRVANGRTYILEPHAPYYALPIPDDIIEQAGIPQN